MNVLSNFVVSDFTTKANLFNNIFASQCSPVVNSSTLPNFCYKTQKRTSDIEIKDSCISQMLPLTQEIHKSFDCNSPKNVRGIF